jgi:uroporphyrinogen-III synthase
VSPSSRGPFAGYTIGITGHRRWEEQAEMFARRGARITHGPVMNTELLGDLDATSAATAEVLAAPVDVAVLTTGLGVRSWFEAAASVGLDEELRVALGTAEVLARGPKARAAASGVGVEVTWTAPGETNREVLAELAESGIVRGKRVVVQRDGGGPRFAAAVAALGAAEVVDVPIYRWHLPADPAPATRLLDAAAAGQVDAVTFTCSYAVHNAFDLASDRARLATAFGGDVLAVAVGPVTADALRGHGVARVVQPDRARLGSMVHALVAELDARARTLCHAGATLRWQGTTLIDGTGGETELTRGEAKLLATLVDCSPQVVPKSAWVDGADDHAAEAAVARLRSKLGPLAGGVRTVRRRGYASSLGVS